MNIANAEIQQFTNSFDNTMHIYVISEKTKSQFPRFFVLEKLFHQNLQNIIYLFKTIIL